MDRTARAVVSGRLARHRSGLGLVARCLGQGLCDGRFGGGDRLGLCPVGLDRGDPHHCAGQPCIAKRRAPTRLKPDRSRPPARTVPGSAGGDLGAESRSLGTPPRMSHLSPALYATLADVVPDLHVHCADPWCLIGSVAALVLGAEVSVADVDVLTSRADADTLMQVWAQQREP